MSDDKPSSKSYINGVNPCKLETHFDSYKEDLIMALTQVTETHGAIALMKEDTKHLEPIKKVLEKIDTSLLSAVLGKDMVPMGVTQTLLSDQRNAYLSIIKTLCWAFSIIVLTLVGLKYLTPHLFGA